MDDTREVDVLRYVLTMVATALPENTWVADSLPTPDELQQHLPCVIVDLLPGGEMKAWGGSGFPLTDRFELDIDVIAASRAKAVPIGVAVRRMLHALPNTSGVVVDVTAPAMSTRPDYNPHVKRIGCTATVVVSNAT